MTMGHPFNDEDLSAFLDGEATPELQSQIEAELETNPDLVAKLQNLAMADDKIRAGFDAILRDAPALPDSLRSSEAPKSASKFGFGAGAISGLIAASVLFAAVSFFSKAPQSNPDWTEYVAAYQALYVPATVASADFTSEKARQQIDALDGEIGIDLSSLPPLQGLELRRAQLLGFEGRPLLQIVFSDPAGAPVALCIIASETDLHMTEVAKTMEGMESVFWTNAEHEFLLIGSDDQSQLIKASSVIRKAI